LRPSLRHTCVRLQQRKRRPLPFVRRRRQKRRSCWRSSLGSVGKRSRCQPRRCCHMLRSTGRRRSRRHRRPRRSAPLNRYKEPSVGSCTSNLLRRSLALVHLPRRCSSSWARPSSSPIVPIMNRGRHQPARLICRG